MKDREQLTVVSDQIGSPTYAADLAEMIVHILQFTEEQQTWNGGIYHFTNQGETSWYTLLKKFSDWPIPRVRVATRYRRGVWFSCNKTPIQCATDNQDLQYVSC